MEGPFFKNMLFYNWVSFLMFLMLKLPYRISRVPVSRVRPWIWVPGTGKGGETKGCQIQGPGRCQKQETADTLKKASVWRSGGRRESDCRRCCRQIKADAVGEAQPRISPQALRLRCGDLCIVCLGPRLGSALRSFLRAWGLGIRSFNLS